MDGDGWPRGPGAPSPGPGSGSEPRRRPRAGHWSTASRLESWTPEPSVLPSTLWSIDRCERHFYFSLWKFSFRSLSVVSQPDVNENEAGPKFLRGGGDTLLPTHFLATVFRVISSLPYPHLVTACPARIVTSSRYNSREKHNWRVTSGNRVWKQRTASRDN